jgi:integrase
MEKSNKRERVKKYIGVYSRESSQKKHNGKPDKCFDISYKDQRNKLVWEKVGWLSEGYTAAFASEIRSNRVKAIRHGDELPKDKPVEPILNEIWDKFYELNRLSKKTINDDLGRYKNHIEPKFGKLPLSKIKVVDIKGFKNELIEKDKISGFKSKKKPADNESEEEKKVIKKLAPATIKQIIIIIRRLFNFASEIEMWDGSNPIKKGELPEINNQRYRWLKKDEADILLDKIKSTSTQLYHIAFTGLHTGMRAGEIFGIKWCHIDFATDNIHIFDTKTNIPRNIEMTNILKQLLLNFGVKKGILSIENEGKEENNHLSSENIVKLIGEPEELVFKSRLEGRIKDISSSFDRVINDIGFNNGITDPRLRITFHSLRHTYASWLAINGYTLQEIRDRLGHQNIKTTQRYAHLIPNNLRYGVKHVNEIFD